MPFFTYEVIDDNGIKKFGRLEKDNLEAVFLYLRSKKFTPIKVHKTTILELDISELWLNYRKISLSDIAYLCRDLSFILNAGVELSQSFQIVSKSNRFNKGMKNLLQVITRRLLKGEKLFEAINSSGAFPPLFAIMCRIGQISSRLPQIMADAADYYEKEFKNRQSIISVMLYPIILLIMMIAVLIIAMLYVLPNYAMIFQSEGIELPFPTRILMSMSSFFNSYPLQSVLIFIVIITTFATCIKSASGKKFITNAKFTFPGLRSICLVNMNLQFCRTIVVLLKAGESIIISVDAALQSMNDSFLELRKTIRAGLEKGQLLSEIIAESDYFDPMLIDMIRIGEEISELSNVLEKCVDYFQNKSDYNIAIINRLIEPLMMLILGSILAFVMLAVILPTFTLTNAL